MDRAMIHFLTGEKTMIIAYEEPIQSEVFMPILSHLLQMADGYRRNGSPKQAMEMYYELVERNPKSIEGQQARERLVDIAAEYEQQGLPHQARSIYESLLE
jgi:tetratricopeptide (TPR) repeat protein